MSQAEGAAWGADAVVVIGGGGHAKVVIDILRRMQPEMAVVGVLDPNPELAGGRVNGVPVLGDDDELEGLRRQGLRRLVLGLGSVPGNSRRRQLFESLREQGFEWVSAIDPAAVVAASASLGVGVTVMPAAVVNADAQLGDNVIVNTGAIVEHDCRLGPHVHVATGARLAGGVTVGQGSHIGLGASIREGVTIGDEAVVGAGAVVVKDVAPGTTVVGVPARERG